MEHMKRDKYMDLKWMVFMRDMNSNEIVEFNIFKHSRFLNDTKKAIEEAATKEELAEKMKRVLQYYYWSKCEFEIRIMEPFPRDESVGRKVDICEQVIKLNYDVFINYLWENAKKKGSEE